MKRRFLTNDPNHRNAWDLFAGNWVSDLSEVDPSLPAGGFPGFRSDPRPCEAAAHLGRDGRFEGYDILELGPLEGAHSFQLETLGARSVTAVETNSDAFLKSLIVKNIAGLNRSTFLLGDACRHLEAAGPRYDLIFCVGVLYHMHDPFELIRLCAARSDRLFVWTHYFLDQPRLARLKRREIEQDGRRVRLYEWDYTRRGRGLGLFTGGNQATARWMELPLLLETLERHGLSEITVIRNEPDAANAPCVTLAAARPGTAPPRA